MSTISPKDIDAILPQTQCGLCGYGGCMPYAEALSLGDVPIHLCPPGGMKTMQNIGELLGISVTHADETALKEKIKPQQIAVIREAECIGCTKCITACPVDAIIGAAKVMHTILADECTGCELCIPACPVDCIDLLQTGDGMLHTQPDLSRKRFEEKKKREMTRARSKNKELNANASTMRNDHEQKQAELKNYIQAALLRAKQKKTQ